MADNVTADPGSGGATFASDDIGGVQYPRVKLVHGADNTNDGDVSTANPLPVDVREVAGAAILTGGGVESGAVRVTVASDSTGVLSVDDGGSTLSVDDGSGSLTVDNAGTFAVQVDGAALTALQLIDDAVYTDGTGTPSKGLAVMGTDGTNPQLLSVNTSGHVNIADGGNAITVDGAVTANAGTNLNTSALALETGGNLAAIATDAAAMESLLGTIDADTSALAGTVDGGEMQVDVVTSALPTGAATAANQSTIIGHVDGIEGLLTTIDADTGGILTAVQLIDNAIDGNEMQVDVVAALPAGTNTIGNVGLVPLTSGGLSIFRSIDLDESEEEIKGTAGQVYGVIAFNMTASPLYLKFYNATAASVTVGTTTPVMTIPIPSPGDTSGAGFVFQVPQGIAFGTAITAAVTTGVADADTGAPGANAAIIQVFYA